MDIMCCFRNIQEMARAVRESAELMEGREYSARPWNRFDPENSEWWIVPSADWPAYRYGKGVFKPSERLPNWVLCGLYVEKGFDRIVADAYPELIGRGHIMDEYWTWTTFLEGLADGTIARAAQIVAKETNRPAILEVDTWYTSSPTDFDPHPLLDAEALAGECRSPLDAGRVWFTIVDGALEKQEERCIADVMAPIANCHHLSGLHEAFQTAPHVPWTWMNVYLGALVSPVREGQTSSSPWSASDIWRKLLRPWLPWIV